MQKPTLFLLIALACLVSGLLITAKVVPVGTLAAVYVIFPVGGVFLGMYLIWRSLEKESAEFDHGGQSPAQGKPNSGSARGCTDHGCHASEKR